MNEKFNPKRVVDFLNKRETVSRFWFLWACFLSFFLGAFLQRFGYFG